MVKARGKAAKVVEFWQTVEMFSPPSVPKTQRSEDASGPVTFDLGPRDVVPWETGHPPGARPAPRGRDWQYAVYGGLYELSAVNTALVSTFKGAKGYTDREITGQTALFAFTLNSSGDILLNSPTLSACGWAIGHLTSPGSAHPGWLDGFPDEERQFAAGLNRLAPLPVVPDERPGSRTGRSVGRQLRGAAREAAASGAKATGTIVTAAAGAALGAVAGPIVGGIAAAVAGTFVEKVLTPPAPQKAEPGSANPDTPAAARTRRMSAPDLHNLVADLARALGVATSLRPSGVRIRCVLVKDRDSAEATEQNFLNSFIAPDLARVAAAVDAGDIGAGVAAYLTEGADIPIMNRIDVRERRETVIAGVMPQRVPDGRWPTDVTKPLAIGQQFAVNEIMARLLGGSGIFAVNGPPGTGKTTLLRDIMAAVIVERATALAAFSHPADAFDSALQKVELSDRYSATVRSLRPELAGFEMVVATASNGAAENVTAEIPSLEAVRGHSAEALAAGYFPDLASRVLGTEAWGLIAATLGNMENRRAFAKRFWWTTEARQSTADDPYDPPAPEPGMRDILKLALRHPEDVEDWATAVDRFRGAAKHVQTLADERQSVAADLGRIAGCRDAAANAAERLHMAAVERQKRLREMEPAAAARDRHVEPVLEVEGRYQAHHAEQPNFWVSLSTLFRAGRRWDAEHRELRAERDALRARADQAQQQVERCAANLSAADADHRHREQVAANAARDLAQAQGRIDEAHERWPTSIPDGLQLDSDEAFQLCTPWADPEFTNARTRLFLEALRLHHTFLLRAGPALRDNLAVITKVISDRIPVKPDALLAAWQSLFLVVPVMSTTFASLPRLFERHGRESIGWLFVDEAGQATPQQATGGIWRARRTVIVGDPQQLEPIVTLPVPSQHALLRSHGVPEAWLPAGNSAQRTADRLARYGTYLPDPDDMVGAGNTWVGSPLRVHRRCDRLMFEVSNKIAYGGDLMVFGTRFEGVFPGESLWIDVKPGRNAGNWVPEEGRALVALLEELTAQGIRLSEQARVISPFRDVVRGAGNVITTSRHGQDLEVGTVHTVQGKEADVVILVLGGAPQNDGARAWAAERPNLLNVAVSRARRRLYVIGDRDRWHTLRHFDVLAATLPVRTWRP